MSLANGLIAMCIIIGAGSVAMVGFALWLKNRENKPENHSHA